MGRLLKFLLITVAAFVGLGLLLSLAVYLFFDPNDYRDEIAAQVRDATGRELRIEGDLSLRLFPWLAIEVGRTELGNAAGFGDTPMLRFEQARLSVRLLPLLLRREVAVGTATLDGLQVNLAVLPDGSNNWEDLATGGAEEADEETDEEAEEAGAAARLDIDGIRVVNASVSYRDEQAGSRYALSDLSVRSTRIAAGLPFELQAGFGFSSSPGGIGGQLSVSATVTLAEDYQRLDIDGLNISGRLNGIAAGPTELNFDARAIDIDLAQQQVTPGEMDLALLGLNMTAEVKTFSYAGTPALRMSLQVNEFSLKDLMRTLGTEPPQTADPAAMQRLSFSAKAALDDDVMSLTAMTLRLDDTTMTGELQVPLTAAGKLLFDLRANSISVDPYMAPADSGADSTEEFAAEQAEIPAALIRSLNVSGTLRLGKAMLGGVLFENMRLDVNAARGKLRLQPISAELFDGSYQGDVRIDVSGDTPSISVNERIAGVSLASLARAMFGQDNITGTINGSFVLRGSGPNLAAIQQDLDGELSFELLDGAFAGTDVWHQLRSARAMFKQEPAPEPRLPLRTEFTSVSASGKVNDGVFTNNDLLLELPFLRLTGSGTVNLVAAEVDYAMQVRVLDRPEFVERASAEEIADLSAVVIPVKISGPLASPRIVPDLEALVRQEVERQVEEKKEQLKQEVLQRIFGKDPQQDTAPAADGTDEDKSTEEEVIDALRDIFKR